MMRRVTAIPWGYCDHQEKCPKDHVFYFHTWKEMNSEPVAVLEDHTGQIWLVPARSVRFNQPPPVR